MIKKRILILEINEKNFNALEKFLSSKSYEPINYNKITDLNEVLPTIDVVLVNTNIDYVYIENIDNQINKDFTVKIPIIYLDNSKEADKELIIKCYKYGASDFIKRPFSTKEILYRINYHCEQFCKMREYKLRVDKLAHLATVDQMSKLTSKMHMQAILKHQLDKFNRFQNPTSILYIGLISVNKVVSTFGFEYGEKMVHSFSKHLKSLIKDTNEISRWNGSNFMVLLNQTDITQAQTIAKKLNNTLSRIEIMKNTKPIIATGITEFTQNDSLEEIEQRAVYAQKEAKKQEYGRIYSC